VALKEKAQTILTTYCKSLLAKADSVLNVSKIEGKLKQCTSVLSEAAFVYSLTGL